tara:strand:- start:8973 stop:11108 length:2136 start_codon:yes stop_codon:yes gene_type:complete
MSNLLQGPSKLNQAHYDVLRVLYALTEVDFPQKDSKKHSVIIGKNSLGQILIVCPDGITYNISCALRNANLEYFKTPKDIIDKLTSLDKSKFNDFLVDDEEYIYGVELEALQKYTGSSYKSFNKLLRGDPFAEHVDLDQLKLDFIQSLLTISVSNKNYGRKSIANVELDYNDIPFIFSNNNIYRLLSIIPPGMFSQMFYGDVVQHVQGLTSFTELEGGSPAIQHQKILKIVANRGRVKSIRNLSSLPIEEEVLMTHGHWIYDTPKIVEHTPMGANKSPQSIISIYARQVHGLVTENQDHYFSELALSVAYENHLRHPYKEIPEYKRDSIYRPNHALAHHVRVVSYTEPVISYFGKYAIDQKFRDFCNDLSNYEIELIKVFLAFSRTGRESETGPLENLAKFRAELNASANNLALFLEQQLQIPMEEICLWTDILKDMGNPDFDKNIDENDSNKNKKIFLHQIVNFAHKLDLQRCFSKTQYFEAIKKYTPGHSICVLTEESINELKKLNKLAKLSLLKTGETLYFVVDDVDYVDYVDVTASSEVFKHSNTDVCYCLDICVFVKNIVFNSKEEPKIPLAILDNVDQNTVSQPILRKFRETLDITEGGMTLFEFSNVVSVNNNRISKSFQNGGINFVDNDINLNNFENNVISNDIKSNNLDNSIIYSLVEIIKSNNLDKSIIYSLIKSNNLENQIIDNDIKSIELKKKIINKIQ